MQNDIDNECKNDIGQSIANLTSTADEQFITHIC